ncbi:MAG: uroporphyrinogen-III C-methyltransferase [Planctomycetes bacterium]|nr:uroporphyrinogen-III C-methyltransferase [Planctomycetota bacterium]
MPAGSARALPAVALVGAGPGDPGLLTLRARDLLSRADVVIHDALVSQGVLALAAKGAERAFVGKRGGGRHTPQEEIHRLMIEHARAGRRVVRLKGGDPFIFGRGSQEAAALAEARVPFEVVPGVSAGVAVPAYAGIPLTERDRASHVTFVTAHEDPASPASRVNWRALAAAGGTLVVFMGARTLAGVSEALVSGGRAASTPAAVIENGTTPRQRVVEGPLAEIASLAAARGVGAPAILVVGEVAALRQTCAWFERRPLFGWTVIVTRAHEGAPCLGSLLEEAGARCVRAPSIAFAPPLDKGPLERAVREAGQYDWIVLTSPTAIERFFEEVARQGLDARHFHNVRFAVVGSSSAARLRREGIAADAQPDSFTAEALAREFFRRGGDCTGRRFLLPRSDIATPDLPAALRALGATVDEVIAYRTSGVGDGRSTAHPKSGGEMREVIESGERFVLAFASSSAARNFSAMLTPDLREVVRQRGVIAAIGPSTASTLEAECGWPPAIVAAEHTLEGLAAAIVEYAAARNV